MKRNYEMDMTCGPILPKLTAFVIPLLISNILQLLFNAVDLIVVGQWTGSDALAAVGATTALISMFINLFVGISLGANVYTAKYFARNDEKVVSETVHTSILTALIAGIVMLGGGLLFARPALLLMDTPEDVIDQAVLYMRIYFCGMPFFMIYNYGAAILRAVGDTKRPLYFLITAGVLNAVLNMVLVIVFHLGVAGVAIATVFSQFISCVLVMRCLMRTDAMYKLSLSRLHINLRILGRLLSIGLPAGIQSTVINFSNVLLQSSVNSFGSTAMAGYTAANSLLGFLYMSINAITQACMSFTSQNYGVRRNDRVKKVLAECIALEIGVAGVLGMLVYLCGELLLGIYSGSADVIACGTEILSITTPLYFMCGIMDCLPGHLRGMGHSAIPMVLSVIGTVGTRIVWIYLLFPTHRSLYFLFISYPVSWAVTILLQGICLAFVYRSVAHKEAAYKEAADV